MASQTQQTPHSKRPTIAEGERTDNWLMAPLTFFLVFGFFVVWATFRTFNNDHFLIEKYNYLSPFYSPLITLPDSWQVMIGGRSFHISPSLLILPFPLSFRLSCYYYRKALYRSYLADPLACAVKEPKPLDNMRYRKYMGERVFPLVAVNFHRYAFFAAAIFMVFLWKDAFEACTVPVASGGVKIGFGLGTLIFFVNVSLLTAYTFSCHSWRHFIGGKADCYSCSALSKTRYGLWQKVSFLNEKHGTWAMMSLISVLVTDIYVFLVSSGVLTDIRFFN